MTVQSLESVEDLKALAEELVQKARALGCRSAVVAISIDEVDGNKVPTGHSLYGSCLYGPCLDLDGLARRITQATDANWRHSISSVSYPTGEGGGGSSGQTTACGPASPTGAGSDTNRK